MMRGGEFDGLCAFAMRAHARHTLITDADYRPIAHYHKTSRRSPRSPVDITIRLMTIARFTVRCPIF